MKFRHINLSMFRFQYDCLDQKLQATRNCVAWKPYYFIQSRPWIMTSSHTWVWFNQDIEMNLMEQSIRLMPGLEGSDMFLRQKPMKWFLLNCWNKFDVWVEHRLECRRNCLQNFQLSKIIIFPSTLWCKRACSHWHRLLWWPKETWVYQKRLRFTPSLQLLLYVVNGYNYLQGNHVHTVFRYILMGHPVDYTKRSLVSVFWNNFSLTMGLFYTCCLIIISIDWFGRSQTTNR